MILIPKIFNPDTQLTLEYLSLKTPQGQLTLQAKMIWPKDSPASPEDITDLTQNINIILSARAPKSLVDEVMSIIADLPYFDEYSAVEQQKFMALQDEINIIFQQNSILAK